MITGQQKHDSGLRSLNQPADRMGFQRLLYGFWAILLAAFLIFPFLTPSGDTGFVTCRFHELTGLSCPTCGISRSLDALVHGHLAESFRMHLFGPVIYLIALGLFVKVTVAGVTGKNLVTTVTGNRVKQILAIFAGLWIVYWLARMAVELFH